MDPIKNPFAPGAGTPPPELAGRDKILEQADVTFRRVAVGKSEKSVMLIGLRGVGKTVLLNRLEKLAIEAGYETTILEAPEGKSLAEMLVPKLRTLLIRMSNTEKAKDLAGRALGTLRRFASAFKVSIADVEFAVDGGQGTADSGNIEADVTDLLVTVATVAKAAGRPVVLLIDEIQYLEEADFAAVIVADHRVNQLELPLVVVGAGLPTVAALAGEAKSYAERLFSYPGVGSLPPDAAKDAVRKPLNREGVDIEESALQMLLQKTQNYPYFIQEWGYHSWNAAKTSPICLADVVEATKRATERLDESFFRVRMDRLTPKEKSYVRAMAELGAGPHKSSDIAAKMNEKMQSLSPLRSALIGKGMIFSPSYGETAFTVPMFDEYLKRAIPTWPVKSE